MRLADADLTFVVSAAYNRGFSGEGEVLSSSPKSATKSVPGTKVDLVVSNGVALVEVPNVVGLPYPTAYATLTQADRSARRSRLPASRPRIIVPKVGIALRVV